ncbi:hypothetical protein [Teichococcus vastitatis]|uniref:Uncharacterized protein n=1 Tax=Teichococcus vastitatis TaxID=2307076 RepID=A0ABS9W6Q0_9PROT|nr:hypothetical protein [Pseudoroseomonas vastitatis]MCI0754971.1 hypothetical protein [Pseudoroseomonas vastitatis]
MVMGGTARHLGAPQEGLGRWPIQVTVVLGAWSALVAIGVVVAAYAWT